MADSQTADIFISYARPNEPQAKLAGEALRAAGYNVWRDDELPAHRAYSEVIEERIKSAKAVLVLWSNDAARSQWVRAEADAARELGTLVQVSLDGVLPPMPFNQIQCADLMGWRGDAGSSGWQKVVSSISSLVGSGTAAAEQEARPSGRRAVVCVPPFQNMSGDAEQEYFSDGISEDIIVDLSKVSALNVVPRKTAFALKGKDVELGDLARDFGATHFLEGSVRKAGSRVRITVELLDCNNGEQVWAERYDRDLDDIFAIQDEISKAIVAALKVRLLPQEKKAIETRGTSNAEAYNLYLMARQQWVSGTFGNPRREEAVIRFCTQATLLDPGYAQAWGLKGLAELDLKFVHGQDLNALPAAERALELDPDLPEALAIKARYLEEEGRVDEAEKQIRQALEIDPNSWEVNREIARMLFRHGHIKDSIPFFEKAASLMDTDWSNPMMLITCYDSVGEAMLMRAAAQKSLERAEMALAKDPTNGTAMAVGAYSLAMFGDGDRAREWIRRALLLDPDNLQMRYNLGCTILRQLGDADEAITAFEPFFAKLSSATILRHVEVDPDLDRIRDDSRFKEMLAAAKTRLGLDRATADG